MQFLRNKDEVVVGEIEANFFMISNVQCYYECDLLSVLFDEVGCGIALGLFLWRKRRERRSNGYLKGLSIFGGRAPY